MPLRQNPGKFYVPTSFGIHAFIVPAVWCYDAHLLFSIADDEME